MTNLILILLITLLDGILADNSHDFNDFGKEGEIILNKIDVSKDRTLFRILKNVINDNNNISDDVHFYSVYLSDFEGETWITVAAEPYENIYGNEKYDGYFIMDNYLFVINNTGSYKLPPIITSESSKFKTYIPEPVHDDQLELNFYVMDGAFAWYVRDIGWVWEITDITKLNTENAQYILTVPKRKSK